MCCTVANQHQPVAPLSLTVEHYTNAPLPSDGQNPKSITTSKSVIKIQPTLRSIPFTANPPVEDIQPDLRLIQRHHMPSSVDSDKGEIAMALHLPHLFSLAIELQVLELAHVVFFLSWPLEGFRPCVIPKPIADIVCVALKFLVNLMCA